MNSMNKVLGKKLTNEKVKDYEKKIGRMFDEILNIIQQMTVESNEWSKKRMKGLNDYALQKKEGSLNREFLYYTIDCTVIFSEYLAVFHVVNNTVKSIAKSLEPFEKQYDDTLEMVKELSKELSSSQE